MKGYKHYIDNFKGVIYQLYGDGSANSLQKPLQIL